MPLRKIIPHLKTTPRMARMYLLLGIFLICLPSILSLYKGHEGKFLVSTGALGGSYFDETVIYLTKHDFWGAQGFIINRPIKTRAFRTPFPELKWNVDLFQGGPVGYGTDNALLLETPGALNDFVIVGVNQLREEKPEIITALEQRTNVDRPKLFVGYAGWTVMQLNREIGLWGAWGVIDYDPVLMFETPPQDIWNQAMQKLMAERPVAAPGI